MTNASWQKHYRDICPFSKKDVCSLSRERNSNKNDYGRLGIIAGSLGMAGAGKLCANAAIRAGAGVVSIAGPISIIESYRFSLSEVMTFALSDADGAVGEDQTLVLEFLKNKDACAIGPGMGFEKNVHTTLKTVLSIGIPTVIDADALNSMASYGTELLSDAAGPVVVTPHHGEMARLLQVERAQIEENPNFFALAFAKKYHCIVVLKGAYTIVTDGKRSVLITSGSAGMAKGGSGDVLCGVIAAFVMQPKHDIFSAVCSAVYLTGKAGEIASEKYGQTAMLPSDTIHSLHKVFLPFEASKG